MSHLQFYQGHTSSSGLQQLRLFKFSALGTHLFVEFGKCFAGEGKGLIVGDVPVKDIEFVKCHGFLESQNFKESREHNIMIFFKVGYLWDQHSHNLKGLYNLSIPCEELLLKMSQKIWKQRTKPIGLMDRLYI